MFIKPRCFIPIRIVPFIKAFRSNVGSILTVFKNSDAIIAPWPGQINAAWEDFWLACKTTVTKMKPLRLSKRMRGRSHISDLAAVIDRADFAAFKYSVCAAEDEVDRALNEAVHVTLAERTGDAQFICQKTTIAINQIGGKRPGKQRILRRRKPGCS